MPSRSRSAALITLLTDFGSQDPYVGIMKGVILGICPHARIVDICHDLTPFEIPEGGFTLSQAWHFFPKGTVHVVVVDPGVGSERRPIAVDAFGHRFIGPDNGVFTMLFREAAATGKKKPYTVREITNKKLFLSEVSNTFHGRDIFAPAAAHLAAGKRFSAVGNAVKDALRQDWDLPVRTGKRFWSGCVLKADRFGNLITNYRVNEFPLKTGAFSLQAGAEQVVEAVTCYADAPFGQLVMLVGSSGYWEVTANQGSAARRLGLRTGSPLELSVFG